MSASWPPAISRKSEVLLVSAIVILALVLRIIAPWYAPRGWRDDELSSALVVTGHVLEGDFRVYYPDASGHEGLYEYFQAVSMLLFGPGAWGVRGPSILFGALAVVLTYLLTRRLFDWPTAAIASVALAVSFWSLMYSRSGQRHISVTVTTLLSFYFLWRASMRATDHSSHPAWRDFALSGLFVGLGFYTYFASRGLPLIVIAWGAYLLIWKRDWFQRAWRGLVLTLLIALALGIPLALTLRAQPDAESRVSEVAEPIRRAQTGDFSMLAEYTVSTLSMFSHDGDEEWLYNIPHRPVFGILGALLFWAGVLIAIRRTFGSSRDPRTAFLLLWLGAGITPGMLSVPAASLGHTILAQPVSMIFPAFAIVTAARSLSQTPALVATSASGFALGTALLFLGWEGVRGVYDYMVAWPADPYNRLLHNTDLHEAARWLEDHAETRNLAVGGYLLERWDQQALLIDLQADDWRIRFFDPRSTLMEIPDGGLAVIPATLLGGWGGSQLGEPLGLDAPYEIRPVASPTPSPEPLAQWDNGLALLGYDAYLEGTQLLVVTHWHVAQPLDLPPFPLLSKPPAPGDDDSPRLLIFVHLLDFAGQWVSGADGLGVNPYTLYPGDVFHHRMAVPLDAVPPGAYQLTVGLYNQSTMQRRLIAGMDRDSLFLQDFQR